MDKTIDEVVDYLNAKSNKRFRGSTRGTRLKIRRRIEDGFCLSDFKKVIDLKSEEWKGTDMDKYLRPETLFGRNFESYLNQKPKSNKDKNRYKVIYKIDGYKDFLTLMKHMPYEEYLKTEHWRHFREEAILFFGKKCQLCNSKERTIHIHHKTYENRGRETFNDVIPLCHICHKKIHAMEEKKESLA